MTRERQSVFTGLHWTRTSAAGRSFPGRGRDDGARAVPRASAPGSTPPQSDQLGLGKQRRPQPRNCGLFRTALSRRTGPVVGNGVDGGNHAHLAAGQREAPEWLGGLCEVGSFFVQRVAG